MLVQTKHAQSSANKTQMCLTAVRTLLWRDEERTSLICREKVTELLTAEHLIVTRKSSSKWDMLSQQSIKFKSAWQLSEHFVEGWRTNTSHLSRESHQITWSWRPGCNFEKLIQMRHAQSTLKTFQECKAQHVFVEGWTSLINSWILKSPKICLKRTAKSWVLRGQHEQD